MSNHPVFAPRLTKSNVEMILRYIDAEIQPPSMYPLQIEHVAARNEGLTKAAEIVRNMWLAATVAADAASQEFRAGHAEGEVPDEVP